MHNPLLNSVIHILKKYIDIYILRISLVLAFFFSLSSHLSPDLILYFLTTRRMFICLTDCLSVCMSVCLSNCLSVSFLSLSHLFFWKLTFLSKSLIKSNMLGDTGELMLIYTFFKYFPVLKILMITAFFSFKRKLRGHVERIKD